MPPSQKQGNTSIDPRAVNTDQLSAPFQTATKQQLTWPLDEVTQNILKRFLNSLITTFTTTGGASGNTFASALLKLGNRAFAFGIYAKLILCTPNSTSDTYTLGPDLTTGGQGSLSDDMFVTVFSPDPGTTPTGIDNGSGYFIVNATATTVQLSLTKGGAAINFTTNGTGPQYIAF